LNQVQINDKLIFDQEILFKILLYAYQVTVVNLFF